MKNIEAITQAPCKRKEKTRRNEKDTKKRTCHPRYPSSITNDAHHYAESTTI